MKKNVLFVMTSVLMTVSSFTVNAETRSVGYRLWDSNNGITATTDPSQDDATAEEVLAAINSFHSPTGVYLPEIAPQWNVVSGDRSVIVRGLRPGNIVTVYQIDGRIVSSLPAKSSTETIPAPSKGIYIVKVNDSAVKVPVR